MGHSFGYELEAANRSFMGACVQVAVSSIRWSGH